MKEALKLALAKLKNIEHPDCTDEIMAIEQALAQPELCKYGQEPKSCTSSPMDCQCAIDATFAQPEQEPVAWMKEGWGPDCGPYIEFYRDDEIGWRDRKEWTPLYTTPPQRTWVGLTPKEELDAESVQIHGIEAVIKWVEAKLKEKNT